MTRSPVPRVARKDIYICPIKSNQYLIPTFRYSAKGRHVGVVNVRNPLMTSRPTILANNGITNDGILILQLRCLGTLFTSIRLG